MFKLMDKILHSIDCFNSTYDMWFICFRIQLKQNIEYIKKAFSATNPVSINLFLPVPVWVFMLSSVHYEYYIHKE